MIRLNFSWEDFCAVVVALVILAIVVYAVAFTIDMAKTELACARHGWAGYKVTWNFESYCLREENEYEIVRPLIDILEEGIQ